MDSAEQSRVEDSAAWWAAPWWALAWLLTRGRMGKPMWTREAGPDKPYAMAVRLPPHGPWTYRDGPPPGAYRPPPPPAPPRRSPG